MRGVSDVQSIDRTWMITLQSVMGPFGMMDQMGLGVVYHVAELLGDTAHVTLNEPSDQTTPNTEALAYLTSSFVRMHSNWDSRCSAYWAVMCPALAPRQTAKQCV